MDQYLEGDPKLSGEPPVLPQISSTPSWGFLCLPIELRLMIYHLWIPRNRVVKMYKPSLNTDWDTDSSVFKYDIDPTKDSASQDDMENSKDMPAYDTMDWENYRDLRFWADFLENRHYSHGKQAGITTNILVLSKLISKECLNVLYGDNFFRISLSEANQKLLLWNFTESNRQRMRRLLIVARPFGSTYKPDKRPVDELWRSILPNVQSLRIITQQPRRVRARDKWGRWRQGPGLGLPVPTLEDDVVDRIDWVSPFLKCFGQHISGKAEVEMDHDGRMETESAAEQCFRKGYKKVRFRFIDNFSNARAGEDGTNNPWYGMGYEGTSYDLGGF